MNDPQPGPAELPNFGPPSTPRPASGIVLLRRGGKHSERALEVLLLKRSEEAKFMPGVWVFPGGALDPEDGEGDDEPGRESRGLHGYVPHMLFVEGEVLGFDAGGMAAGPVPSRENSRRSASAFM